jgi:outer membrane protein OmpA-like peptidoglycan-associated protein/tetratricopeptide (TPR) repeat protein
MKQFSFCIFIVFFIGVFSLKVNAQEVITLDKNYQKALYAWSKKNAKQAIHYLEKALAQNEASLEVSITLAEWNTQIHAYEKSYQILKNTYSLVPNNQKEKYTKKLVKSALLASRTDEAKQWLSKCLIQDATYVHLQKHVQFVAENSSIRAGAIVQNLGIRINTSFPEMFPFVSADSTELLFTRKVNNIDDELYKAQRDTCGFWLRAKNEGYPINSPDAELYQSYSADGHYQFITRCDTRSENGWSLGACDLLMAYRSDSFWTVPESFGGTINTTDYEGMPCLSADNKTLFFISNKKGGYGGMDIWMSHFKDGLWQEPINLGPKINTAGNEFAPFLHPDGKHFYFSSDGHLGFGGLDLFTANWLQDTVWSYPRNLGLPVNTAFDDMSIFVFQNGNATYFSSDRDSMAGNFDIYAGNLPSFAMADEVVYMKGVVYDSVSKEPLNNAFIDFIDQKNDKSYQVLSNRGDGSYMIPLLKNTNYTIRLKRYSYQAKDTTILIPIANSSNAYPLSFALLSNDYEPPVFDSLLARMHFEINKTILTDSLILELSSRVKSLITDKAYQWSINCFTDNSGNPILNETISAKRAQILKSLLIQLGVDQEKITMNAMGEQNPIDDNATEEGRLNNRRVEIWIRK